MTIITVEGDHVLMLYSESESRRSGSIIHRMSCLRKRPISFWLSVNENFQ